MTSRLQEGKEQSAYQISTRYVNSWPIQLLPVAENKRSPYLNSTPGFDDLFTVIGMWFAPTFYIFYELEDQRRSYDFILILQDSGYSVANLLSVSGLSIFDMWEALKLSAYQISTRYLNALTRYYYFRFLKTNGRHIDILLPVSFLTFSLWFCSSLPNFMQIEWTPTESWGHIDFKRRWP